MRKLFKLHNWLFGYLAVILEVTHVSRPILGSGASVGPRRLRMCQALFVRAVPGTRRTRSAATGQAHQPFIWVPARLPRPSRFPLGSRTMGMANRGRTVA